MGYKALFIDIDGTLMSSKRKYLSKRSMVTLKLLQTKGILVISATGRGYRAIRPEILGGVVPDYNICFNGACVLNNTGDILFAHSMSHAQMELLWHLAEVNHYSLGFAFAEGYYTYYNDFIFREFYRENNGDMECLINGTDRIRHIKDMPFSAFGLIPESEAIAFNNLNNGLLMIPFKKDSYDICQREINKATGAEQLLKYLHIDWEDVVAIGDGANDCELLRAAGAGVAMDNAVYSAKEAADFITGDVLEDGAADAIQKLFCLEETPALCHPEPCYDSD